jgi:hypothetical protein
MNINRFLSRSFQRFFNIFRKTIRQCKNSIIPNRVLLAKADPQGKGLQIDLAIDLYEAMLGCQKKIRFKHWETLANGSMRLTTKTTILEIPPGVEYGTRLQLTGVDVCVDRQAPCDLYVFISAPLSQDNLRRDGNDLLSIIEITQKQAERGAKINVDTIDGVDRLVVPPGTQSGSYVTLVGRGVSKMGSPNERGNHLFRLVFESSQPDKPLKLPALKAQIQSNSLPKISVSNYQIHSDLKILLEELVERGWAKEAGSWHSEFALQPSDLAEADTLDRVVKVLLDRARCVAPNFSVPYLVPRIVVESKPTGVGQFEVDEEGWVTITVSPTFFNDKLAAQAILAHEVCHYILENSGIYYRDVELNERYTDLCMFVCGFGRVFKSGYQREPAQNEYRPGHRLGYLTDAEYEFADRYVQELRKSHPLKLTSELSTLKQQLLQLTKNDRALSDRLIKYERSKNPGKSEVSLHKDAIDRLRRDRR